MSKSQRSSQRSQRSQRSRIASSLSSSSQSNLPRKRFKRCCRDFVTFMCTQVGVGALIILYAIVGAVSIMNIEHNYIVNEQNNKALEIFEIRKNCSEKLWDITEKFNTLDKKQWQNNTIEIIMEHQVEIVKRIKNGYYGQKPEEIWSFPAALMFCLSVITMIGYGNLVPHTDWGKGFTVIYATFGIPLYILYFLNIGRVLAKSFKFLYRRMHDCTSEQQQDGFENVSISATSTHRKKIIVPSTACLWVILFYIAIGTIMFANWEKWSYLNSFYFCLTSLCKIGFGDFVPGAHIPDIFVINENDKPKEIKETELRVFTEQNSKLAINFFYMLLGMGLVAMCYNLMREEVRVKLKEMKEDAKLCFEDVRKRFNCCCDQDDYYDNDDDEDDADYNYDY